MNSEFLADTFVSLYELICAYCTRINPREKSKDGEISKLS